MCVIIHIYSTLKVQWWGYLKELFQQGSKSGLCLILNSLVYFKSKALICQQINPYFLPQLFPREIHYWKLLMVSEGLWWFMYVMSWARYMRSKRVGDSVPCNQNSCQRCVCVCPCVCPTCHCWSAVVSGGDARMFQPCQANGIEFLSHGIDWNDRMSVNVSLKCLWKMSWSMYYGFIDNNKKKKEIDIWDLEQQ